MSTIMQNFVLQGVDARTIDIEINSTFGKPMMAMIGLADQAIKESSERIKAAVIHSGYEIPKGKIVFNLAPADMKKRGTHYDLAMALGLLVEDEQVVSTRIESCIFFGELSLNGNLRRCKGILPMIIAAKQAGYSNIILPKENLQEAALIEGLCIMGFSTLKEVVAFMEGNGELESYSSGGEVQPIKEVNGLSCDFSEVLGQQNVVEKAMIAAAGGHNILLIGEPGCGKSMIAKRIPTILPRMSKREALEVTKIYSVAGLLSDQGNLITERPFRSPHHNASLSALIGGGRNAMPGEISLAHNGVLFLDEMVEFSRKTLESLRQPIEDKIVQITRINDVNTCPANFMLVAAMNPCPCGYAGTPKCQCSASQIHKYQQKLSGPIMDRIDIIVEVKPVDFLSEAKQVYSPASSMLKERVESARYIQRKRYKAYPTIHCNAQMTPQLAKEFCKLDDASIDYLKKVQELGGLSARRYTRILRVARTIADMNERKNIAYEDVVDAVQGIER